MSTSLSHKMIHLFLCIILLLSLKMVSSLSENATKTEVKIADTTVSIYKPVTNEQPAGITFLLTGANTAIKQYESLIDVILNQNQWVIGYYINVLMPLTNNHESKAKQVKLIFDGFLQEYPDILIDEYSIVGHSAGGKVALLVTAKHDPMRVKTILALDPVDQNPSAFTDKINPRKNLSLMDTNTTIVMTLTDGGMGISKDHDAGAINRANLGATKLVKHEGAGHMVYTDNNGGLMGWMMGKGTKRGNLAAVSGTKKLIEQLI